MLKYIEKLREAKVQVPGDESFFYAYFCDLRNSGIALSRLRSIVEAIRFTEFVLALKGSVRDCFLRGALVLPEEWVRQY